MDQDDPENRIAELEGQLADQKRMAALQHRQAEPVQPSGVTPEEIRNVAFSKPLMGNRGYNEDEVDRYLELIAATLRDPTARGGVTPADIRNMAFSKPPIGKRGYNEGEVDAFLDRLEIELARRAVQQSVVDPDQGSQQDFGAPAGVSPRPVFPGEQSAASAEPIRCLLFATLGKPWGAASLTTPSLAIDVGKDAMRVIDPSTYALIASASLAQVTATAENYTYVERGGRRLRGR